MYVSVEVPQISAGIAAGTVTMLIAVARNTSVPVCRTGGRGMPYLINDGLYILRPNVGL